MEGYNGYARPLDSMVRQHGSAVQHQQPEAGTVQGDLSGSAKSDRNDARKGLELFQLRDHLPLAKEVLQEVLGTPQENEVLKRLTRRRRRLVNERVRVVNNLQADLQAVCPGLLEITRSGQSVVFKLSSQCGYPCAAGPASKSDFAEDPCGGQKVCKPHRGLAEAGALWCGG